MGNWGAVALWGNWGQWCCGETGGSGVMGKLGAVALWGNWGSGVVGNWGSGVVGKLKELASFRNTTKCRQQLVRRVKHSEGNIHRNNLDVSFPMLLINLTRVALEVPKCSSDRLSNNNNTGTTIPAQQYWHNNGGTTAEGPGHTDRRKLYHSATLSIAKFILTDL